MAQFMRDAISGEPKTLRRLHAFLTIGWFLAAFPICLFLAESIPFLVFISVYAVVTGHWSAWQATRVEEKQDEELGEAVDELNGSE